ncbi:MAG: hypothetical protein ACREI9_07740 [Nitrospiraceae bacterium]
MTEPTTEDVRGLAAQILETIKIGGKEFLDQNKEAKDLLIDRAETLARLTLKYKFESDTTVRNDLLDEMKIVQQTISNELSAVALAGQAASRDLFMKIVDTAFGALIKYVPVILSHI